MKKRVAAILEFVSQMQTQNHKDKTVINSNGSNSRSSGSGKGGNSTPNSMQIAGIPTSSLVQAVTAGLETEDGDGIKLRFAEEIDFGKMGSRDMMETLMKELVGWQSQFGVYSR